jgi:hypothetical protein
MITMSKPISIDTRKGAYGFTPSKANIPNITTVIASAITVKANVFK